jgi:hypothetical protein
MNTLATASLVLAAALATAFTLPAAATPLPADHAVLVVSCDADARLSQRAVAGLLDTNNGHAVYEGRNRLIAQVRRACRKAGIERVAIVGRETSTVVAVAPAAPASGSIADN